MTEPKRYVITSALPYANGPKHIGHLAGAYLPADIYVRYLRAKKKDVVYVCGSDEHGAAITIQAMKENTTPRAIVDKYHTMLKNNMADLGISFDIYHRTSAPIHHETAREFFTVLNNNSDLEQKETEQYYDEETSTFLADRYIIGTCPVCGNENAYGDQCEKCGTSLSPEQLINPRSTLSGNAPVKKTTTHWYLPLNKHEDFLRQWILQEHKEDWKANVLGQCKGWIEAGLQPRAVTRDLNWGIALPENLQGGAGKVLYVWFDAPIGYISATKQWALDNNKDWKPYWQDKDTKLVHFIGKDNIVFHCIIFPVMLKLHGDILPDNVPSNEFMNLEGDKMSTSRGWSVEMEDYINDFVKKENGGDQMVDALRYYLTAIAPETKDSEFTWKGFQDAVNSELVSIFGNFVNRAFVLMHKLCKGKVPPLHADILDDADKNLFAEIAKTKIAVENLIEGYKLQNKVILWGAQKNVSKFYAGSKIFAMPSAFEGFPVALCEAMANGCACIAFNCELGPADIIENNINGLLIEDQNEEKFLTGLSQLMNSPEDITRFSEKAKHFFDKVDIKKLIFKWEAAVEEVIRK